MWRAIPFLCPQVHLRVTATAILQEWVDVAILDADTVALGGVTGLAIADRGTGELLDQERNIVFIEWIAMKIAS